MRNEADVKKAIKALIRRYGGWYCMPIGTGFGKQGVPDFVCCIEGLFLAIEAKYGNNKPTALQVEQIGGIQRARGQVMVVNERNLHELENVLRGMTHYDSEGYA